MQAGCMTAVSWMVSGAVAGIASQNRAHRMSVCYEDDLDDVTNGRLNVNRVHALDRLWRH